MKPFFSIVMPLYNCEGTLQQTLDSINCQAFKNYELVLVDGGSNDDTQYIISNFKKQVRLVSSSFLNPTRAFMMP
ncbi:glycosyltransferase family 2 protein [Mucilaginibacter sp. P25]|uniref:glycosyltransferase family 2 protein n=1 Tax=Mucilaginibacter sp. P25 TaxID=3423945 RepID=UPI003D7A867A